MAKRSHARRSALWATVCLTVLAGVAFGQLPLPQPQLPDDPGEQDPAQPVEPAPAPDPVPVTTEETPTATAPVATTADGVQSIALPMMAEGRYVVDMTAVADGKYLFLVTQDAEGSAGWVVNTRTTKELRLDTAIATSLGLEKMQVLSLSPSPDGLFVAASYVTDPQTTEQSCCLYSFRSGKAVKLVTGQAVRSAWAGQKLLLSTLDDRKETRPVYLLDVASRRTEKMGLSGMVSMASADGEAILAGFDPDRPERAMGQLAYQEAWLCVVSPEGKLTAKIEQNMHVLGQAVISPSGKYVAYMRARRRSAIARPQAMGVQVTQVGKEQGRLITAPLSVLGVSDDGAVTCVSQRGRQGLWIYRHRPADPTEEPGQLLVEGAQMATQSPWGLYYVLLSDMTTVKFLPAAKEAPAATTQP